ncbi:hypothetical protein F4859DRAFT_73019 [Xylaria cf. heliscus]|nr:hypothetical protein F4859DRAFT_73019 [Xylaria cf. heliscus]
MPIRSITYLPSSISSWTLVTSRRTSQLKRRMVVHTYGQTDRHTHTHRHIRRICKIATLPPHLFYMVLLYPSILPSLAPVLFVDLCRYTHQPFSYSVTLEPHVAPGFIFGTDKLFGCSKKQLPAHVSPCLRGSLSMSTLTHRQPASFPSLPSLPSLPSHRHHHHPHHHEFVSRKCRMHPHPDRETVHRSVRRTCIPGTAHDAIPHHHHHTPRTFMLPAH